MLKLHIKAGRCICSAEGSETAPSEHAFTHCQLVIEAIPDSNYRGSEGMLPSGLIYVVHLT